MPVLYRVATTRNGEKDELLHEIVELFGQNGGTFAQIKERFDIYYQHTDACADSSTRARNHFPVVKQLNQHYERCFLDAINNETIEVFKGTPLVKAYYTNENTRWNGDPKLIKLIPVRTIIDFDDDRDSEWTHESISEDTVLANFKLEERKYIKDLLHKWWIDGHVAVVYVRNTEPNLA